MSLFGKFSSSRDGVSVGIVFATASQMQQNVLPSKLVEQVLRLGAGSRKKQPSVDPLDKKDEVWCYVLIKLFTAMLEDPEEAKRLMKPSKSAFDVDLEPAVQQLKKAIDRKKSEHSTVTTTKKPTSKVPANSEETSSYDVTETNSPSSSDSSSSSSSSVNAVDLKSLLKVLAKANDSKASRAKSPSFSTTNSPAARGDRSQYLSTLMTALNADRS